MKKLLYLFLVFIYLTSCNDQKPDSLGFTINGKIDGLDDCKIAVVYRSPDKEGFDTLGTTELREGSFHLSGIVAQPTPARILLLNTEKRYQGINILVDNVDYLIRGEYGRSYKFDILGGEWHEKLFNQYYYHPDYAYFYRVAMGYYLDDKFLAKTLESIDDPLLREDLGTKFRRNYSRANKVLRREVNLDYRDTDDLTFKALLLTTYFEKIYPVEQEDVEEIISHFGPNHYYSRIIKSKYDQLVYSQKTDELLQVGNKSLDLTVTIDGETQMLFDITAANKYTLLEFWASWCGPCRAEIPNLKKAYGEFKGKGFEILSISIDKNKDAWEKAREQEQLTWIDILDEDNAAQKAYNVTGIPFNVLLDSQGNIVGKNLRGEELENKLSEVLP